MFKNQVIPFIDTTAPNSVTKNYDGFYLSFNNRTSDYGSITTAIVFDHTLFYILNGDHRSELLAIAETDGKQGVIDYFIDNIDQANKLSEHHFLIDGANDNSTWQMLV